jgi:hypothetical protein
MNEELSNCETVPLSSREIEDLKQKEASIKIQEDQVQHIIKLLTEEFNIDNADENSGGSEGKETGDTADTGFDEARSDEKEEEKEEEVNSNSENTEQYSDDTGTDYVNLNANEQLLVNTERDDTHLTELNLERHNTEANEFQYSRGETLDGEDRDEDSCEPDSTENDYDEAVLNESEILDETERQAYLDVVAFVIKAKDFGANAIDLSKRKLKKLPKELLDLNNLQVCQVNFVINYQKMQTLSLFFKYIYLEGNKLEKLPSKFFLVFKDLKWLDVR